MVAQVSLTGLTNEEIIAYTRWTLSQQVTAPDDSWVPDVSGMVLETPNQDHFNLAWLNTTGEFVDVSVGGIPEETISSEKVVRHYTEFGKAFRVTNKERRLGLTSEVQMKIDEKMTAYSRIWANQLLGTLKESAAGSGTARSLGIDGKALFATDHPNPAGGAAISNKISHDVEDADAITVAEAEKLIWMLVETMMTYPDSHGRPQNESAMSFTIFAPWQMRRPLAYALGAQLILDGGETRTNLMAQANGMNFRLVTTTYLSSWWDTTPEIAMCINDGKSFWRARDPRSLIVETEDKGIQGRATTFATFEERGVGAADWQSSIHVTLGDA